MLLVIYYVLTLLFVIFLSLRLDESIMWDSHKILAMMYIGLIPHLIGTINDIKEKGFGESYKEFFFVLGCNVLVTLIILNLSGTA